MIQAIETVYKGCKFRSRLEARWAVFFETLGLRWNYEPEGFRLSKRLYLPDFFLPDHRFYFEVKPVPNPEPMGFLSEFAEQSGCRVFLLEGQIPWFNHRDCLNGDKDEWCREFFSEGEDSCLPCICPKCGAFGLAFSGWADRIVCCERPDVGRYNGEDHERLRLAYSEARKARFEHEDSHAGGLTVNGQILTGEQVLALALNRVKLIP